VSVSGATRAVRVNFDTKLNRENPQSTSTYCLSDFESAVIKWLGSNIMFHKSQKFELSRL